MRIFGLTGGGSIIGVLLDFARDMRVVRGRVFRDYTTPQRVVPIAS